MSDQKKDNGQDLEELSELEEAGAQELTGTLGEDGGEADEADTASSHAKLARQRREAAQAGPREEETTRSMTPEEAQAKADSIEAKRARIIQVLDRGILNHKLRSIEDAVPTGFVAVFPRDRPEDIDRIRALGGRLAKRDDLTRDVTGLHGDGDESLRVGDVVLMLLDQETAEIIDEVQEQNVEKKLARGKRQYHEKRDPEVPVIDYSHQQRVGGR